MTSTSPYRRQFAALGLGLGLLLTGSGAASAALTVQELFDGIAGPPPGVDSPLNGKGDTATSIGMTGAWTTNGSVGISVASNFNAGPTLPGLPASNGVTGGVWNSANSYTDSIYATRPLASSINFSVAQTIYFSVRLSNSGDSAMGIGLSTGGAATDEFIGAGFSWNNHRSIETGNNDAGNAAYIAYGTLGGVVPLTTVAGVYGVRDHEVAGSVNGAGLLVGRIIINAAGADLIDIVRYGVGDTIQADPALVTWSASDSVDSSMTASNLLLWVNGAGSGEVDAIRFGQSWADVTGVVPEPGTALLGLLAVSAWVRRRR